MLVLVDSPLSGGGRTAAGGGGSARSTFVFGIVFETVTVTVIVFVSVSVVLRCTTTATKMQLEKFVVVAVTLDSTAAGLLGCCSRYSSIGIYPSSC